MHPCPSKKALIRRFIEEVLNQKTLDAIDDICSPDFVEHDPLPGQEPGAAGLKQFFAQHFFPAFPDLHWMVEQMVAEGEYVMARSTWTGTHQGPFLGIPPTNKRATVAAWTSDHIVDGKFTDSRIIMDALGMLQQLGAIPPAGPGWLTHYAQHPSAALDARRGRFRVTWYPNKRYHASVVE